MVASRGLGKERSETPVKNRGGGGDSRLGWQMRQE